MEGKKQMSTKTVKHFNGTQELDSFFVGVNEKGKLVCRIASDIETRKPIFIPVTRTIFFSNTPKLHKCGARCQSAKGGDCECQCRGKNHGAF